MAKRCGPDRSICGMQNGLYNPFFTGLISSGFPLSKISIQYNNTDFAYLANDTGTFADLTSFRTNANVIDVFKVSDNANPNTGLSPDFAGDRIAVMEMQGSSSDAIIKFFNRDGTLDDTVSISGAHQGLSIDPIKNRIFGYLGSSGNEIKVFNMSGVYQYTIPVAAGYQGGGCRYDWQEEKLYVTDTGSSPSDLQQVLVYQETGLDTQVWNLIDTMWFVSAEGFDIDYIRNKFVLWEDTSYIQTYSRSGPLVSEQFNVAIQSSNKEGIISDPKDGTIWQNIDDGFHAALTNGNRVYWTDPLRVFLKYFRSPDMIPWEAWAGVTVSGYYNNSTITGTVIYSPVFDAASYTFHQALSTITLEGGTGTVLARSSATAPTGGSRVTAAYLGDTGYYANIGNNQDAVWGSTTPGSYGSSITDRYFQLKITLEEYTAPIEAWTPLDLGEDVLDFLMEFDPQNTCVTREINANDDSINYRRAFNKANPGTNDTEIQTTPSLQPQWNSGTAAMRMGSRTWLINTPSNLLSQQQGEWLFIGAKTAASTPGPMIIQYDPANAGDNQLSIEHFASTDANANTIGSRITDGSENVINKMVSPADANLTFKLRSVGSDGSTTRITINKVQQTVTAATGTNTGEFSGDVSGASLRFARRSATSGNVGGYDYRMAMHLKRLATSDDLIKIYDYYVSRGFLV